MVRKSIVLTGGAGFIGANVLRYLNEQGITQVVIVDNLGSDIKWKNLVGAQFAEIVAINSLFTWLENRTDQIEAIIHLGACSSTTEINADYLLENNYRYTVKLAEYALKYEIRFIYASSAATYGDGSLGFSDDHDLLQSLHPLNMYGYSKHLFDLWALQQGILDQIVGLKYFNVFGPYENHKGKMASIIVSLVPQALEDGKLRLFRSTDSANYADGGQMRDFIYVKDAARMTCKFLDSKSIGGIFNIGRGIATTWNELASCVMKALNLPIQIEYVDMPKELAKQYQNYTCADMTKYCQSFNLDTVDTQPLLDSVTEYVQQYLLKN